MAVEKKAVAATESEAETDVNSAAIEGLEQATDETAAAEPSDIEDFHASSDDESMEETLANLKEEESETTEGSSAFADADTEEGNDVTDETESNASETTENQAENQENGELTISLTGNMTLRLRYQYEGQDVIIGFKDHALQVRMSDGTEFKVPIRGGRKLRSVA